MAFQTISTPPYIKFTYHQKVVAAFDFDGTITRKDTMFAFISHVKGGFSLQFGILVLSPMLAMYALGLISRKKAKEIFLGYFFADYTEEELYKEGERFCNQVLPQLIRPHAQACIDWHKSQGHQCFLVTASLSYWTKAWADKNGFVLIATEAETQNNLLTGKIKGENCHGQAKVNRLLAALDPGVTYRVYGYGDSEGDRELLRWVDIPSFRPFE